MGIQSTQYLRRTAAIERINAVLSLAIQKDYHGLRQASLEDDEDGWTPYTMLTRACEAFPYLLEVEPSKWDNTMLGDVMDLPFFRHSIFDNYVVLSDEEADRVNQEEADRWARIREK